MAGRAIAWAYRDRVPCRGLHFDVGLPAFTHEITARLFFGLYESAEIRFIRRELRGARYIVELGASLGITGSFALEVASDDATVVFVEANPSLIQDLSITLRQHRRSGQRIEVIGGAISYGQGAATLGIGQTNVGSSLGAGGTQISVDRVSLEKAVRQLGDPGEFCLICDIEGAEHDLLEKEGRLLERCRVAIVECHDDEARGKTWQDAQSGFAAVGFTVSDRRGRVIALRRKS